MLRFLLLILCALWGQLCGQCLPDFSPAEPFMTWAKDPCRSALIEWFTNPICQNARISVREEGKEENVMAGEIIPLKGSKEILCRLELQDLTPGKRYYIHIGDDPKEFFFETLKDELEAPLRFAVGGDAYLYEELFHETNLQIARMHPEFVVIGGDIAYTRGIRSWFNHPYSEIQRWKKFFHLYSKDFTSKEGRLMPLVVTLGNHDVPAFSEGKDAVDYFFPHLKERSYNLFQVGGYLSLFLLDTGHRSPIEGPQTAWLEKALKGQRRTPYRFAIYHIAAYPSVYAFEGKTPRRIRENWVPLFERYAIQAAFEHHNHAFKVTHPLKGGKIDPSGIVYAGDGSWGTPPRAPRNPDQRPYLLEARQVNCFWLLDLSPESCLISSYDGRGNPLHQFSVSATPDSAQRVSLAP